MEKDLMVNLKESGLEMQPYWSAKYLKNVERLSKPEYKVKEEYDVYAPVRDGTKLCMDIFRPDVEGKTGELRCKYVYCNCWRWSARLLPN